eukprot:47525-Eustigmatos_ZCMA.PRE.3
MVVMIMNLKLPFATISLCVNGVNRGKVLLSGRLAPQKCYSTACITNGNLMTAQHWADPHPGNNSSIGTDMN